MYKLIRLFGDIRFLVDEGESPRQEDILMDSRESRVKHRDTINMSMTNMPTETRVVSDIFG